MEDGGIGGLLFVVIAMILSFVSSSKKRQKMSQRDIEPDDEQETDSGGIPPFGRVLDDDEANRPHERSLEDIFGEFFPFPKEDVKQPAVENTEKESVLPNVISNQATSLPQGGRLVVQSFSQDDETDMFMSEYSDSMQSDSNLDSTDRAVVDVKKFIDEFDIGKAVIYSEILTPKYKEY